MIAPKLEEFANTYADKLVIVKVNKNLFQSRSMLKMCYFKVDVDECEELAMKYNISSMPTFVFIKKGQQVDSFSGANAEKLEKFIIQHSS